MIRSLILKRLDREEQSLGESVEYVRHILRTSLPAFFKFALFTPLSQHRRKLPPTPYRVARIVATRDEDCGSCVQIEVNLARREGVPVDIIRAVVNDRPEELTPELADVYGFTKAVVEASGEEEDLRQRIRDRYGEEGLVELALGMAAARLFPITKRALGYAISCALVDVKASQQE
jgi:alkylhydroperoxidase family enzyme